MSDIKDADHTLNLILEYDLDAPPETVWRAISLAEFRQRWLPQHDLSDAEPLSCDPGAAISYRMRDDKPPFLESLVTFQLSRNVEDGTRLRITHRLSDARAQSRSSLAANTNRMCVMRAA